MRRHRFVPPLASLRALGVVDAGPSHFSAFHVIGTIFQSVMQDGNPQNVGDADHGAMGAFEAR